MRSKRHKQRKGCLERMKGGEVVYITLVSFKTNRRKREEFLAK